MTNLNEQELNIARDIIGVGLKRSADSLSFLMHDTIVSEWPNDFDNVGHELPKIIKGENDLNIHLLLTEVVGELKGTCCLILTEDEANNLRETALPAEIKANAELMAEMNDAILLEADNIITASVITEFSNHLQKRIFGDVPQLKKMNYCELSSFLKEKLDSGAYVLNFRTAFTSTTVKFRPEFFWLLDQNFLDAIKCRAGELKEN
jgi:chemotaxis protein CheY-P-specific phosphatase CheC